MPQTTKKKPQPKPKAIQPKIIQPKVTQPTIAPKKVDYQIVIEKGELAPRIDSFRVFVSDGNGKRLGEFNAAKVHEGFGLDTSGAVNDFIRRNSSDVLNKIFDL